MIRNQHWYNLNETRDYPLDDKASAISDHGARLPANIVTDLRVRYPDHLGAYPFISVVAVTPGAVTVAVQVATTMDNVDSSFTPIAVFTVAIQDLEEGRQYAMEAQYPGVFGYIVIGSGAQKNFTGSFSTPDQTLIAPRAARPHHGLPIPSIGKLTNSSALTGVVQLLGEAPIEIVKESREIDGVEQDVIVIRLLEDAAVPETGQTAISVFSQFAGPCGKRPESQSCGPPQPIEFINAVSPDCTGTICLKIKGTVAVGKNLDDCSIIFDSPVGLVDTCVPPFLPDHHGILPSEATPLNIIPPDPIEPPLPPDESISDSVIVVGELPHCVNFDDYTSDLFAVKEGSWLFADDDSPEEICPTPAPPPVPPDESISLSDSYFPPEPGGSYATEGVFSASSRNVTVWQGFDVTTLFRRVTTDIKITAGPPGASHNGGIVINYRPHASAPGLFVYYLAQIDYDFQQVQIMRWNGSLYVPAVSVPVPGIMLDSWYRMIVSIVPPANNSSAIGITVKVEGIDDPSVSVTVGPLLVNNYRPADGYFGFAAVRSHTRFSFFYLEEFLGP